MSDTGKSNANLAMTKIISLLEKTRDALLADLESEFVCVRTAIDDFEAKQKNQTDLKKCFGNISSSSELFALQTNIINGIFARLGFELANKEGVEQIRGLVTKMFEAVDALVGACKTAAGSSAGDLFGLMQTGGELFKSVKKLLDSVKAFEANTIAKVLNDNAEQAEKVIKDFDLKGFAGRVFDHVLIVLLKNARTVFADEIAFVRMKASGIITDAGKGLDEARKNLESQINSLGNEAQSMAQALFGDVQREVEGLYAQLSSEARKALNDMKPNDNIYQTLSDGLSKTYAILSFLGIIGPKTIELHVPKRLVNALNNAQKGINTVTEEIAKAATAADGKLKKAEEMGREGIEAVNEKTKKMSELLGGDLSISTNLFNLSQFSMLSFVRDVQAGVGKGIDKLADLTELTYPIEVVEIKWDVLDDLFAHPLDYLKRLYPIENIDDAQALVSKVMDLARQFNPDIPDFASLRSMLETLVRNLAEKVLTTVGEAKKELWNKIRPIITTIRKIIDMLRELAETMQRDMDAMVEEAIACLDTALNIVGNELSAAYDKGARFEKDLEALLTEAANNAWKGAKDEVKEARKAVLRHVPKVKVSPAEKELFDEVLVGAVKDVLKKWQVPNPETVITSLAQAANTEIRAWGSGVYTHMHKALSKRAWENRLKTALMQLKAELRKDLNTISVDGIGAGVQTNNLATLLSPHTVKQLSGNMEKKLSQIKSELSLTDYVNIVTKAANEVIVPNPERYYMGFRQCVDTIVGNCKAQIPDIKADDIDRFAKDLAEAIWQHVKQKIFMPYVREITATVTSTLRLIIRQRLQQVVKGLDGMVKDAMNLASDAKKTAGEVVDLVTEGVSVAEKLLEAQALTALKEAKDTGQRVLKFINEKTGVTINVDIPEAYVVWFGKVVDATIVFATSPMGYKDIFTLVMSLYKGLPNEVHKYIDDVLPSIPDNDFTQYVRNIDYQYDLESKFLLATLVNLTDVKAANASKTASLDTSLLVQLCTFVGEDKEEKRPAIFFHVMLKGDLAATFKLGKNHTLALQAQLQAGRVEVGAIDKDTIDALQSGFGFNVTKGWKVNNVTKWDKICAMFVAKFARNADAPPLKLFDTKYLAASIDNYPQLLYLGYANTCSEAIGGTGLSIAPKTHESNKLMFGYLGAIKGAKVVLKLSEVELLKTFLKDDFTMDFDTYLWFDLQEGLDFGGNARLKLRFDLNGKTLGPVRFNHFDIDFGPKPEVAGTLALNVKSTFQINFASVVTMALEDLGVGLDVNYRKPDGSVGDWDLSAQLALPTGLGITIDNAAVKGGGIISINKETGEFFGAVELNIVKLFAVSGFVLCDTGSKPGHDFSLVVLISTRFTPGIPLGLGFSLTGVGGCLGLNREISREGMVQSVRQGTLGSVFFVENLSNHLAEMKASVMTLFPAKKGQFFFGLLAQISYEPILKCDFGLLLQLPSPTEILIVGGLKVSLPKLDKIIRINVFFAGGIRFEEGMWFDAALVDSQIVGLTLEGEMAFRLNWGGPNKGFLLSVGGFHPAYKPEPGLMVSNMKRMAVKLDYKIVRMSLESYLAITSNTFQIGARLDINVGWKRFGLHGYAGFDALFQFDPFRFVFTAVAGMSVRVGSWNVASVHLSLDVEGPAPWKIKGKASFRIIFKINVDFNLTWGNNADPIEAKTIEVWPLLEAEYEKASNWLITNTDMVDNLVRFVDQKNDDENLQVLQPTGKITFNQTAVPMKTVHESNNLLALDKMEKCNDALPIDCVSLEVQQVSFGSNANPEQCEFKRGKGFVDEQNDFAPSLYRELSVDDKIKAPSYIKCNSGFTIDGMNEGHPAFDENSKRVMENSIKYETWKKKGVVVSYAEKVRNDKAFRTRKIELDNGVDKKIERIDKLEGKDIEFTPKPKMKLAGIPVKAFIGKNNIERLTQGTEKEMTNIRHKPSVWRHAAAFEKLVIKDSDLLSNVQLCEDGLAVKGDGSVVGYFSPKEVEDLVNEKLGVLGRLKWPRRITELPDLKGILAIKDPKFDHAYNSFIRDKVIDFGSLAEVIVQPVTAPKMVSSAFERRDKSSFQRYVKILDQRKSRNSVDQSNLIDKL